MAVVFFHTWRADTYEMLHHCREMVWLMSFWLQPHIHARTKLGCQKAFSIQQQYQAVALRHNLLMELILFHHWLAITKYEHHMGTIYTYISPSLSSVAHIYQFSTVACIAICQFVLIFFVHFTDISCLTCTECMKWHETISFSSFRSVIQKYYY